MQNLKGLFGLIFVAVITVPGFLDAQKTDSRQYHGPPTKPAITPGDLKTRLFIFADDSMRGRAAGTADNLRGTEYIERELRRLGLTPGGENKTYHQDVPVFARMVDKQSAIVVDDQGFALGTDFVQRENGREMSPIAGAQTVYGGSTRDTSRLLSPAAAAGKIIVITMPTGWSISRNAVTNRYPLAAAIAIATLDSMPSAAVKSRLEETSLSLIDGPSGPMRPTFLFISGKLARAMFGGADPRFGKVAVGTVGKTIGGSAGFITEQRPARNVIAILRGSDPKLRGEYVAIGAHNDHEPPLTFSVEHDSLRAYNQVVRPGGAESLLRTPTEDEWARIHAIIDSLRKLRAPRLDSIRNGADDDGSGSMAALEIAEAFAKSRVRPRRSLLFVWHTGEELGLYGSSYFTDHPTVPRDSIVAQLNIDMIGRGSSTDIVAWKNGEPVYGSATFLPVIGSRRLSTELGDIVEQVNAKQSSPLSLDYQLDANGDAHQYYCRSDHYMYARYGIPIAFFFDAGHADYHQVTDEPQYIDYPHYARITRLVYDIAQRVANLDHRVVVDGPRPDPNAACIQ